MHLRLFFLLLLTLAACQKSSRARLVILGFDGMDPRRVQELITRGQLNNLQALGDEGFRGSLATTNPPQSPVAWSAFATGLSAGEHGIFDFVARNPQTYMPEVATTRITHAVLHDDDVEPAKAENLRRGPAFWDTLAAKGIKTTTLFVPYTYPPTTEHAFAGLGTPDVRGTNSSFTWLVTQATETPAGGQVVVLQQNNGRYEGSIQGPRVRVNGKFVSTRLNVNIMLTKNYITLTLGNATQDLHAGETGRYVTVSFETPKPLRIVASTRVTVRKVDPPEIYLEPFSIVPTDPYLPLGGGFAVDLWQALGPFKTVGWVDDTAALSAGAMDEKQFLYEAKQTMNLVEKATLRALRESADDVVVSVFTSPDRVAHMFYKQQPSAIDDTYAEADKIVGHVRAALKKQDTLLVMSDHGFGAFARGFNVNRWLVDQGYMVLKGDGTHDFFEDVDFTQSRAYAFGTGSIYINQRGREAQGIVDAAAAPALIAEIVDKLSTLRDGAQKVMAGAYLGDALYQGRARAMAPDIRVALAPGYRASWGTSLGGIGATVFEDNTKKWSGDHASARPEDMPGILVSNRKITQAAPRIEDLSVTALTMFGIAKPESLIGHGLFEEVVHAQR